MERPPAPTSAVSQALIPWNPELASLRHLVSPHPFIITLLLSENSKGQRKTNSNEMNQIDLTFPTQVLSPKCPKFCSKFLTCHYQAPGRLTGGITAIPPKAPAGTRPTR